MIRRIIKTVERIFHWDEFGTWPRDESRAGLEPATSRSLIEHANQTALPTDAAKLQHRDHTETSRLGNTPSPAPRVETP